MHTPLPGRLLFLLGLVFLLAARVVPAQILPITPRPVDQAGESQRAQLRTLARNEARWNTTARKHYRYVLQPLCFCATEYLRPVTIEVRDGLTVSINRLDDGSPVSYDTYAEQATMPKLFAYLRGVIGQPDRLLEVSYDAKMGYPYKATIHYVPNTEGRRDFVINSVQMLD